MLPALAFNDVFSSRIFGSSDGNLEVHRIVASKYNFKSLVPTSEARFKASHLEVSDFRISAVANTPIFAELERDGPAFMLIPRSGKVKGETKRGTYEFGDNGSAFLCSDDTKSFETSLRSFVRIELNQEKISAVHASMRGSSELSFKLDNSRPIPLVAGGINFLVAFENLYAQLDLVSGNQEFLERLGFDDSFYRLCSLILDPRNLVDDEKLRQPRRHLRREMTTLCEWLSSRLSEPVSTTEMQNKSGLSSRVLQYAFQEAFGMRPKEWLRRQRLHAARALILRQEAETTLTTIAYNFCFASPSDFSQYYKLEFGELPSETVSKYKK